MTIAMPGRGFNLAEFLMPTLFLSWGGAVFNAVKPMKAFLKTVGILFFYSMFSMGVVFGVAFNLAALKK